MGLASYVVHYIMGEKFLNLIQEKNDINISEKDKNDFRLGNLSVDVLGFSHPVVDGLSDEEIIKARRQYRDRKIVKKLETHFRDVNGIDLILNSPKLDYFINKYRELLVRDFSVMGYFFHLYTDKVFFEYFYNCVISCLDENYQPTKFVHNNKYIKINKNGNILLKDEFWNSRHNIYEDYTKLNSYFIQKYGVVKSQIEKLFDEEVINPGIVEVDYSQIDEVLGKMSDYILEGNKFSSDDLLAFNREEFEDFILRKVGNFYLEYHEMILMLLDSRKYGKFKSKRYR